MHNNLYQCYKKTLHEVKDLSKFLLCPSIHIPSMHLRLQYMLLIDIYLRSFCLLSPKKKRLVSFHREDYEREMCCLRFKHRSTFIEALLKVPGSGLATTLHVPLRLQVQDINDVDLLFVQWHSVCVYAVHQIMFKWLERTSIKETT